MIVIEVDQALAKFHKAFEGVKQDTVNKIVAKALNNAMRVARRAGAIEIGQIYNLQQLTYATSKMRGRVAMPHRLQSELRADRLGIQLAKFSPTQDVGKGHYMQVEIKKGQRKTLKGAFWAKANAGRGNELQSVFARGAYQGNRFNFRTKRLIKGPLPDKPIGLLRSASPLDMLNNKRVQDIMSRRASEHFESVLVKEIAALVKTGG